MEGQKIIEDKSDNLMVKGDDESNLILSRMQRWNKTTSYLEILITH